MPEPIPLLPFRHNVKPALGFEIFRLSSLFQRADRRDVPHSLDTPLRLDFHAIYVGISGRGHIEIDFTRVPAGANRIVFSARGRVQAFHERGFDAHMLIFRPDFLATSPGTDDPLVLPQVLSTQWERPGLVVPVAEMRELLALVGQIDAEHGRPLDVVQPHLLSALLRSLLLRAERLAGERTPSPAALTKFFTILERDHLRTRSVAHYAKAAGVSVRRLAELLVAGTGRSTKQVVDDRVVLELKRLLAHTGLSVKELADVAGFAEPTNLVKFFRHHAGQTPLDFRTDRRNLPSRRRS